MSLIHPVDRGVILPGLCERGSCEHNLGDVASEIQGGSPREKPQIPERANLENWLISIVTSLIERLAQETSWQEIYQLVTQASEVLGKNYNDAEPKESVVSRFRQAVGRVKQAVSAQIESWTTSIASNLSRLFRSPTFRKVVNSLLAIVLSLQLTAPVLAAESKQNTLAPSVKAAFVYSSVLGNQAGSVFSPFENQDANTPDGQSEAEKFDLERSLEKLDQYGYLDYLLMQLMIAIEEDSQEEVGFSNIFIQGKKPDGESFTINYSLIFPGKLGLNKDGNFEFVNNFNTPIGDAIGIVVPKTPYVMYINKNTPQEKIQFFSGITYKLGHCCGPDSNYSVFANLGRLQPDDPVVITTTNKRKYQFSVRIVGNVPKEYSMGMVYSDYKTALKFIAAVLLSTPEEPASEEILTQVELILNESPNFSSAIENLQKFLNENGINRNLSEILQKFIRGGAMILMTCDPEATIRTSTGLQSAGRVVAIVELEPGQEPPEFLRPAVFVGSLNESAEEDKKFIKTMIRALYKRFPAIVKKLVQEIMKEISTKLTPTPIPTLTPTPTTNPVPKPTPGSNSDTDSIRQDDTQPSPQPQLSEEEGIQKQIQERIARLQWLNSQVEPVLPPFPIIPQSPNLINLNEFANNVVLGKSASLIELIKFFGSEPKRMAALQEYIQILEELTSAAQGENAQHLQNLIYKLKLVKFLVENYQILGGGGLVGVTVGVLLSLALARRRGRG